MRRRPYGALLESTLAVIGDSMPSKTVTIQLETAKLIRGAFLPANPNKLRSAAPEVVKAARDFIEAVERPRMETAVDCPKCGYKLQSIAHFEHCGHGHVVKRHDGMLTRCGGPSMCKVCAAEQVAINQP